MLSPSGSVNPVNRSDVQRVNVCPTSNVGKVYFWPVKTGPD